jgi:hypothetical protein
MPIKFRCQQCRQFLGISRSKAGSVVDCPTCGRTIRIPDLDGTVRPLPKPSLDLHDSSLARALDELALIGASSEDDFDSRGQKDDFASAVVSDSDDQFQAGSAGDSGDQEHENAAVKTHDPPAANVVDLKPLPPPEPIELNPVESKRREPPPPASFDGDSSAERGWKSTRQGDSWKHLLASAKPDDGLADAPGGAAAAEPVPAAVSGSHENRAALAAAAQPAAFRLAPSTWFAIAGIGALIFAAGFWSGRITTLQAGGSGPLPAGTPDVDGSSTGAPFTDSVSGDVPAIQGRITCRSENGEIRPDVGARIFVLPFEHADATLIPSDSVWIDATDEDRKQANNRIRELGGGFGETGLSGEFHVQLPNAGKFHVLVLCNSRVRDDAIDISDIKQVVGGYFDNPTKLLGHVMLHLDEVQHPGTRTTYWDFQFPRS